MRIVTMIARFLLALIFIVFGLNGFLHFIDMGLPTGLAGQFMGALIQSHYFWVVAALQVIGGVLLLAKRYVPLGLVLLGPVIVNILLYHIFLNPARMGIAIAVTVLWLIVFYDEREHFMSFI